MRVTFVVPTLAVGGGESFLAALAPQLREHGIESSVVALNHRGRFYDVLGAKNVAMSFAAMSSRYDVRGAWRAHRAIRESRPHVIVTGSPDAHVIGRWTARRADVPHVALEHAPVAHPGAGLYLSRHRRLLVRAVAGGFDLVIAVDDAQRAALERLGYRSGRIRTIQNGMPEVEPERAREETRASLGVGEADFLALLVAVLRPQKQATRFVDAVLEARNRGCPVTGVVAGDGPERAAVEARIAGREGVHILGERVDVADLMVAADLVCLTSHAEALPIVVLEAMSLGRPFLSTRVGGVPDALGDTGILVDDSTDAIAAELCAAAADPVRLRELGARARDRFRERFSMDPVAKSYADALRTVVSGHGERDGAG